MHLETHSVGTSSINSRVQQATKWKTKTEREASNKPPGVRNMKPATEFPKSLAGYGITPYQLHTLQTVEVG